MGIKISDMTPVASAAGTELLAASVSGNPRSVSVGQIATHTLAAAAAVTPLLAVATGDGLLLRHAGTMTPVDVDLVTQRAIDILWSKALNAAPSTTDIVPVKAGGTTEKTMTLPVLAEYVRSLIESAILDISDISAVVGINSTDVLLVCQGSTAKKATLSSISTSIYSAFYDYANALSALDTGADEVFLYAMAGGVSRKISLSVVKSWLGVTGYVLAPTSSTENRIPQWDSVSKKLKDGLSLLTEVRATGSTDDVSVPTEQAVREMVDAVKLDDLQATDDNTDLDATTSKHGLMPKLDKIKLDAITYSQTELSADPANPAEGKHIIWQSDGTGAGDDGDIMIKITAGGVTKTATLIDFSAVV